MRSQRVSLTRILADQPSPTMLFVAYAGSILVGVIVHILLVGTYMDLHGDMYHYHRIASAVLNGEALYTDIAFEYPPLAAVPMCLAVIVEHVIGGEIRTFNGVFAGMQLLVVASGLTLLSKRWPIRVILPTLVTCLLLAPLFVFRLDGYLLVFFVAMFWAYSNKRYALLTIVALVGAAFKLSPAIALGLIWLHLLFQREYSAARVIAVVGLLGGFVVAGVCWLLFDSEILTMFAYHSERGVHIESLLGGIWMLLIDTSVFPEYSFGAMHIETPKFVLQLSTYICVLGAAIVAWRVRYGSFAAGMIGLLAFVLLGKVFSPQYLIWFIPLLCLMNIRQSLLWVGIVASTVLLFPLGYMCETLPEWFPFVVVLRGTLLLALVVLLTNLKQHDQAHCLRSQEQRG